MLRHSISSRGGTLAVLRAWRGDVSRSLNYFPRVTKTLVALTQAALFHTIILNVKATANIALLAVDALVLHMTCLLVTRVVVVAVITRHARIAATTVAERLVLMVLALVVPTHAWIASIMVVVPLAPAAVKY